ncbi:MAG TPA: type II secretion system protein [bacterium]|nr:type II secretion system protein [bacterium]
MNNRIPAFTLIETIVALGVLTVLAGLAGYVIVQGNSQMTYALEIDRATILAEMYMEEVLSTHRWDELSHKTGGWGGAIEVDRATIGPEESFRSEYDDCDDYDGFTASGSHQMKDGTPLGPEFDPCTVQIEVDFVEYGSFSATGKPSDLKRIRVSVQWRQMHSIELTAMLANI